MKELEVGMFLVVVSFLFTMVALYVAVQTFEDRTKGRKVKAFLISIFSLPAIALWYLTVETFAPFF